MHPGQDAALFIHAALHGRKMRIVEAGQDDGDGCLTGVGSLRAFALLRGHIAGLLDDLQDAPAYIRAYARTAMDGLIDRAARNAGQLRDPLCCDFQ